MSTIEKVQDEYPGDYCSLLEVAYGKGFLSEGGSEAIDDLMECIELGKKKILEIGSGMGGAAIHIAEKHKATLTGIEINQDMVDEANYRVPSKLQDQVEFLYYSDINNLPFDPESYELAFSKEVFLHLDTQDKLILFKEISRVLKADSYFVILDWLSSINGHWGEKIQELIKIDGLTLFANIEQDYLDIIKGAGFKLISIDSRDETYEQYNREIVEHLQKLEIQKLLEKKFTKKEINDSIRGYQLIADSIRDKELLIRRIVCKKE